MEKTVPAGPPASVAPLAGVTAFTMKRRVTLRRQYHEFRPVGSDGVEGDVVAYQTMKQASLVEEYRFSSDPEHTRRCWTVRARRGVNVGNVVHDVYDAHGHPIGMIQLRWFESHLTPTWRVLGPGLDVVGSHDSLLAGVARVALRRVPFLQIVPIRRGFDMRFRDAAGHEHLQVRGHGDRYLVTMPAGSVDPRLAAAMAAVLDWRASL